MIVNRVAHRAAIIYDVPPGSENPDEERPVVLVSGGTFGDDDRDFEAYDIENDRWYICERFVFDRRMRQHGMCVISHYE